MFFCEILELRLITDQLCHFNLKISNNNGYNQVLNPKVILQTQQFIIIIKISESYVFLDCLNCNGVVLDEIFQFVSLGGRQLTELNTTSVHSSSLYRGIIR